MKRKLSDGRIIEKSTKPFPLPELVTVSLLQNYFSEIGITKVGDALDCLKWCFPGYGREKLSALPSIWNRHHRDIEEMDPEDFKGSVMKAIKYWKEFIYDSKK